MHVYLSNSAKLQFLPGAISLATLMTQKYKFKNLYKTIESIDTKTTQLPVS